MTPKKGSDRKNRLRKRVDHWAIRLSVEPQLIRIRRMVRKWGSCSSNGTITLAADLIDRSEAFQDFVVVHELLHLRIPNHARLFKATMSAHVPQWKTQSVMKSI